MKQSSAYPQSSKPSPFSVRQARLQEAIKQAGLEAIAINPGPTLTYLTGLHFHLSERPTVAIFASDRMPVLVLPRLEMAKVEELPFQLQTFSYGDDPQTWGEAFQQAAQTNGFGQQRVGVEPTRMRYLELTYLQTAAPEMQFVSAAKSLASLRMCKDESELAAMRRAVEIAQTALKNTIPHIRIGATEMELAAELTLQLLRAGSESELPFAPIVSGGPNSANPHATPSERPLQPGDLLVIDWGGAYQGYASDLTRTFAVAEVEPEFTQIAAAVMAANAAGRAAVRPGIPAGEVDRAARAEIVTAGYGPDFIHRTGHGLGLECHEEPYIYEANPLLLSPGMTFTVEPGIYLAGRGGVRIEDNVVVTAEGGDTLSDLPRELLTVGG